MSDFFRSATKATANDDVTGLSGDNLVITITSASVGGKPIYIRAVNGSCDVDFDFSITDSGGKQIEKYSFPNGGIERVNFDKDFAYADAGEDLVVTIAGNTTPTKVFLQVDYAYF